MRHHEINFEFPPICDIENANKCTVCRIAGGGKHTEGEGPGAVEEVADVPSNGNISETGRDAAGKFTKGNKGGGRKKKLDWVNGKGEEALRFAYSVMLDDQAKVELRLQAAKMLVEYDLGKPRQAMEMDMSNIPQVIFMGGERIAD